MTHWYWLQQTIAQTPAGQNAEPPGGMFLGMIVPLMFAFLIFWFVVFQPQKKKQEETRRMLENLKEGDNVITLSGIHGTVRKLKDDVVTLQIADNVRIKINRSSIGTIKDHPAKDD